MTQRRMRYKTNLMKSAVNKRVGIDALLPLNYSITK